MQRYSINPTQCNSSFPLLQFLIKSVLEKTNYWSLLETRTPYIISQSTNKMSHVKSEPLPSFSGNRKSNGVNGRDLSWRKGALRTQAWGFFHISLIPSGMLLNAVFRNCFFLLGGINFLGHETRVLQMRLKFPFWEGGNCWKILLFLRFLDVWRPHKTWAAHQKYPFIPITSGNY